MKVSLGEPHEVDFVNFGYNYTLLLSEVDDGECTEIYAPKILDYIQISDQYNFIQDIVKKMRHKCILTIGGTDIYEATKYILNGTLNINEIGDVLYGDNFHMGKVGCCALHVLSKTIIDCGLTILEKDIHNTDTYIKAIRP